LSRVSPTNATANSSNSSGLKEEDIKQEVVLLSDMEEEQGEEADDFRLGGGYVDEATFGGGGGFDTNYGYEYGENNSSRPAPLSAPVRYNAGGAPRAVDSGEGNFQCPLCFRRYKSAGSLQNHRSLYHRNELGKQPKLVATSDLMVGPSELPDPEEWNSQH
jgi:hypothetical protein